jgi:DNA-binding beta-propeller fold protein YncE
MPRNALTNAGLHMHGVRRALKAGFAVLLMASAAHAAEPSLVLNDPFAAPVWRIDVDAGENHIVAGSPAKAATVWSLDDPAAPELLRVPMRDEEKQRAHAVAISPDGKRVAYSVPPLLDAGKPKPGTSVIYILERGSKRIETQITGVATRPQALRFSPDGTQLAATLSDGCGLRVWNTADWSLTGDQDAGAETACCAANATAIDCDPLPDTPGLAWAKSAAGEPVIVTSGDTGVRVFKTSSGGVSLLASKSPADLSLERPEGVAVSPDGNRLAVADARVRGTSDTVKLQVAILDLATLAPARPPLTLPDSAVLSPSLLNAKQTPAADQMSLNRVAWSEVDGVDTIYAAGVTWCQIADPARVHGTAESDAGDNCIVRWRLGPGLESNDDGNVGFIRAGLDRIMDVAPLPGRKALAYAGLQRIAVINDDGSTYVNDDGAEVFAAASALDMRDRPVDRATNTMLGFDISPDASTVYVEDYRGTAAAPIGLTFNVDGLKLDKVEARPAGLKPPDRDPILIGQLADWWNSPRPPVVHGLPLDQLKGLRDSYRTVALAPGKRAVVGSANFLRLIDYAGGKAAVVCETRVSAEAYRAAISDDGSLAVVGHSDGTLRWYRLPAAGPADTGGCTLTPLLTVNIRQSDQGDGTWTWAAWLPQPGRFAVDTRARDLMGLLVQAGDQVSTVRFADVLQLYDPAAVRAALRPATAVAQAPATAQPYTNLHDTALRDKSLSEAADPLRMSVLTPDENAGIETETLRLDVKIDGGTVWPRKLFVATGGGTRLAKASGDKDFAPGDPVEIAAPGIVPLQIRLPAAERQQHGNIDLCLLVDRQRTCQTVNWTGPLAAPAPRALRAVIVGLSAYKDPELRLNFAQNDALDLARLFVTDYKARVVDKTSKIPADFAAISIDLVVAPLTQSARNELAELQSTGLVRVHEATVANVENVLAGLASGGGDNDLVLFYFSGHGAINPFQDGQGLTVLLGPDVVRSTAGAAAGGLTPEILQRDALTSDRLIALLEAVPGEKLVVIDACRTTAAVSAERPFDPAAIRLEFERNLMTADFFFSAAPGQYSLDQGDLAFSQTRPADERGNGLFTYAMLKSLTDTSDVPPGGKPRKVEIYDVDRYVRGFFDARDRDSAAMRLIGRLAAQGISVTLQQPMFVPARRRSNASTVLRTLEPEP